jgi:hypothetical protein
MKKVSRFFRILKYFPKIVFLRALGDEADHAMTSKRYAMAREPQRR